MGEAAPALGQVLGPWVVGCFTKSVPPRAGAAQHRPRKQACVPNACRRKAAFPQGSVEIRDYGAIWDWGGGAPHFSLGCVSPVRILIGSLRRRIRPEDSSVRHVANAKTRQICQTGQLRRNRTKFGRSGTSIGQHRHNCSKSTEIGQHRPKLVEIARNLAEFVKHRSRSLESLRNRREIGRHRRRLADIAAIGRVRGTCWPIK